MSNRLGLLAGAAILALGMGSAGAAEVKLSDINALWLNPVGGGGGTVINPATPGPSTQVRWPSSGDQSGYNFTVLQDPITVDVPPAPKIFDLGTFTHLNFPIPSGTGITSVQLQISANLTIDGQSIGPKTFLFDFTHFETPNEPGGNSPCANGGANNAGVNINGCADRVTFATSGLTDTFDVNGAEYTLTLTGFVDGDGDLVDAFWTTENLSNSAVLRGSVDVYVPPPTNVPAPPALALLGMGLLGLGFATRRAGRA